MYFPLLLSSFTVNRISWSEYSFVRSFVPRNTITSFIYILCIIFLVLLLLLLLSTKFSLLGFVLCLLIVRNLHSIFFQDTSLTDVLQLLLLFSYSTLTSALSYFNDACMRRLRIFLTINKQTRYKHSRRRKGHNTIKAEVFKLFWEY